MAKLREIEVCACCLMAAENGDRSSCESYCRHGKDAHPKGMSKVGAIPIDFVYVEAIDSTVSERTCEICGSLNLWGAEMAIFRRI